VLFAFSSVWSKIGGMQPPLESIVAVYVRHANRKALDDMLAHRGKLIAGLWTVMSGPYDVSAAIAEIEDDIAVIESGLTKLSSAAAA
jgi:hypothetical protein